MRFHHGFDRVNLHRPALGKFMSVPRKLVSPIILMDVLL
jgi:hypothetical protein